MVLGLALLVLAGLAPFVRPARAVPAVVVAGALLAGAALSGAFGAPRTGALEDVLGDLGALAVAGDDPVARLLLVAGLVWCGPAGDLVVRAVLQRTGLPAPERAAEAGYRAGRWVGRLERWTLLLVVAAGQPALAIIPTGGKALLRYAEAVADARAARGSRLTVPDEQPAPGRDAFLDYVLVGSLASWTQALALGLLIAAV